jgi:hypothetical protein
MSGPYLWHGGVERSMGTFAPCAASIASPVGSMEPFQTLGLGGNCTSLARILFNA